MKLIVGIGNPGEEYRDTRHNIGWEVIDLIGKRFRSKFKKNSLASWGKANIEGEETVIVKPLTYVNASGKAVKYFSSHYRVNTAEILVIHDDLDLELGTIRIKRGGGDGGHNGLKSIINSLLSPDFLRIRVGIGKPQDKTEVVNHVLSSFREGEQQKASDITKQAVDAVCLIMREGEIKAMNRYNKRKTEENTR